MKKANIIVLAGQSNAVGVGHTKYLPSHFDCATVEQIRAGFDNLQINYMSHDVASHGFLKTTVNCTEQSKDTLGPEIGIAKKLLEKFPDEQFFLIKCAYGGSNLKNDWRSPSSGVPYCEDRTVDPKQALTHRELRFAGWCYNTFVKLLKDSFRDLERKGYTPSVIAFCWMQGESDPESDNATEEYINRYDALLKDIQEEFSPYFEGCTYIDAGISEAWEHYEKLNRYKKGYAEQQNHRYIDTIAAGLTTRYEPVEAPDIAHYDCGSIVKLGELFAQEIEL